jgi:hypothetical protein
MSSGFCDSFPEIKFSGVVADEASIEELATVVPMGAPPLEAKSC